MDFSQKVLQFIQKNNLIKAGGTIIVGVSGGADSMSLIHVLVALRHKLGVQLHVAHFNHHMRPEADKEEVFVKQWCLQHHVPVTVERRKGKRRLLSEDEARQARFKFFIRLATQIKAQSVALAHTQNDLAETVLMRLMRGSGLHGLRGILPIRSLEGIVFIRPLIATTRKDIEYYLKIHQTTFCTDSTNHKSVYLRNKVRRDLLPLLVKEYNPQIASVLVDLAATAQEDYGFLEECAQARFQRNVRVLKGSVKILLKNLKGEPISMRRLILSQMAGVLTGDVAALTFDHIQALEDLVNKECQSSVHLPHHLKAVKSLKFLEMMSSPSVFVGDPEV